MIYVNSTVNTVLLFAVLFINPGWSFKCYECDVEYNSTEIKTYTDCLYLNSTKIKDCRGKKQCFETFGIKIASLDSQDPFMGGYIKRDCAIVPNMEDSSGCKSFNDHTGATTAEGFICRCSQDLCNNNTEAYDIPPATGSRLSFQAVALLIELILLLGN